MSWHVCIVEYKICSSNLTTPRDLKLPCINGFSKYPISTDTKTSPFPVVYFVRKLDGGCASQWLELRMCFLIFTFSIEYYPRCPLHLWSLLSFIRGVFSLYLWPPLPCVRGVYLYLCPPFIFTRGQLWPSGIVVACVCLSVCPSVCAVTTCLSAR